jgi:hypothetical protein
MRSVRRFIWPFVVLTVVGMAACSTETELNPQPLPPGQNPPERKGDESGDPAPIGGGSSGSSGSSGTSGGSDAGVKPPDEAGDGGDGGDGG